MSKELKALTDSFELVIKDLTDRIIILETHEAARQETIKKHKPIAVQFATINKQLHWLNKHLVRLMGPEKKNDH